MKSDDVLAGYGDIIRDAVRSLGRKRRQTTSLYLDTAPYRRGDAIGPHCRAKRSCWVVFVAGDGHGCRYRCYDVRSHKWFDEVPARYPPYCGKPCPAGVLKPTLVQIHRPVRATADPRRVHLPQLQPISQQVGQPPPQTITATGQRAKYAILFAGWAERRNLNDLEYCYRMLTEQYGFKPDNVLVYYFDGALTCGEWEVAKQWPSELDHTSYKLENEIKGAGNRAGFQQACAKLALKLKEQDLVFIHTNGHGDAFYANGQLGESYLAQFDANSTYGAADFCSDLAALPKHESLLVLMGQCFSAGFVVPLLNAQMSGQIRVKRISVAAASSAFSHPTPCGAFDAFVHGWITSHMPTDLSGKVLIPSPDKNSSSFIEAEEAFDYAVPAGTAVGDTPVKGNHPDDKNDPQSGNNIRLA